MTILRRLSVFASLLLLISCQQKPASKQEISEQKADKLLAQLTFEEKVEQLKIYSYAAIIRYV
ncbi:hypothetical protein, partial [Salmonella enterica]|uniref:hypothetical protein n=1 Tax=Salmonella enterica TaxID=28901 RepID=UPI003F4B5B7F